MRRLKIVFGGAALLLAGIGAFASTAKAPTAIYFYQTGIIANPCTDVTVNFTCQLDSNVPCLGVADESLNKQLYLTEDCDQPLEKVQ